MTFMISGQKTKQALFLQPWGPHRVRFSVAFFHIYQGLVYQCNELGVRLAMETLWVQLRQAVHSWVPLLASSII